MINNVDIGDEDGDDGIDELSDEIVAVRMWMARFPMHTPSMPAFVLLHMLYTVIHDRASVDSEIVCSAYTTLAMWTGVRWIVRWEWRW